MVSNVNRKVRPKMACGINSFPSVDVSECRTHVCFCAYVTSNRYEQLGKCVMKQIVPKNIWWE